MLDGIPPKRLGKSTAHGKAGTLSAVASFDADASLKPLTRIEQ